MVKFSFCIVILLLLGAVNAKTNIKVITRVVCRQCGQPVRERPLDGVIVKTRCKSSEGSGKSNRNGDSQCDISVDDDDDRVCRTKPTNVPPSCSFLTDFNQAVNGLPFSNCTLTKVTGSGKAKEYNCGTFVFTPGPCGASPAKAPSLPTKVPVPAPTPSNKAPAPAPSKTPSLAPKPPVSAPAPSSSSPSSPIAAPAKPPASAPSHSTKIPPSPSKAASTPSKPPISAGSPSSTKTPSPLRSPAPPPFAKAPPPISSPAPGAPPCTP